LRAAFAGSQAGVVFEEEKRFGLVVRLDKDYRQSLDDVKNLSVGLPGGGQIPFSQIADVSIQSGPAQVSREDTKRRITVGFNVRNRDVQSVIEEVTNKIDKQVKLPAGYYITYGGQFKNLEAAKNRLAFAVPVALILIFILLYFTFKSVRQTLLIYSAVPLSAIGGVFALWLRGMNFSISAGVGFIALFGVAVLNGIVLIAEFNRLEKEGISDITERVIKGLQIRLRPVIITAAVASLGFLPMALSTSAGAEVQKPLATVVIGGLITATLLTLIVLPVFYVIFSSQTFKFSFKSKAAKILPILVLLLTGPAFINEVKAQKAKPISLHDAIQLALDSNLAVRAANYSVEAGKALKGAALDLAKTNLDMGYGQFNSYSRDNNFTISQTFSFPTVYINQSKLADTKVKSNEWQLKGSQLEIATQVKQVYWQLAYLYSLQKLLIYQDSLYSGFQKAAELRSETGETNHLEMITARSQSLEVKNHLRQVNADIGISSRNLLTLLNTREALCPVDTVLKRLTYIPATDSFAFIQNPALGYQQQQIEVSRIEKELERSRMLPDFNIGLYSQTMIGTQDVDDLPRTFGRGDRFTGIQAGIAIPIWFVPFTSKIKAAKINENIARINADNYAKSLSGNYHTLLDEYSKYLGSVEYYEKQAIPEADLIIKQSTQSYQGGAMGYLDYVLSLSRALDIKQNYLDALNNYNQTIINIDFIIGKMF
ncbi:MAG: efflux RND transporter permease subunit, partial [Bacteroidota bacterium]|nr:efflux RND transporter permease subunit [Bacteroidota bacterium]